MSNLSPTKDRLINFAVQVREYGYEPDKAFTARELVQATLPHKNPGIYPNGYEKNGNYALVIQPGWDAFKEESSGYPYGTIPRLLMFWMTTEALRTGDRRLELGTHLAEFMRKLGLNSATGGGKRSDAARLKDQMERLFRAKISFQYQDENQKSWLDMHIAPKGMVWFDHNLTEQPNLWESWIELGEDFFKAITAHPVPVDMQALQALRKSPLALDLYALMGYKAYFATTKNKPQRLSWRSLHEQLGAEYSDLQNFRRYAIHALKQVEAAYPGLKVEVVTGGLEIKPSAPAIAPKSTLKALEDQTPITVNASAISKTDQTTNTFCVTADAIEKARAIALAAGTGWDIYGLEQEYYAYAQKKGKPKYPDRAFIGFVKKKVQNRP